MKILSNKLAQGMPCYPLVFCPGCNEIHVFDQRWTWDGNTNEPTFSPSMLSRSPDHVDITKQVCHSFLKKGVWQFLSDCTHELAGQNVPMINLPDWIINE